MSPSLVSNSTSPVSQSTSIRCGGLCQSVSPGSRKVFRKAQRGSVLETDGFEHFAIKAKKWAASVEVADNSWLQILLDGRSVRSLKPGSF
jgi:hypothetical protein